MNRSGLVLACAIAVLASGCTAGMRRANARLRTENADLKDRVAALEHRAAELEAQLALADRDHGSHGAHAAIPQVAAIAISPLSGLDPSPEGSPALQIHVVAVDGHGRPIQLAGPLEAQVLRPVAGSAPELVASKALQAAGVRDAWRGGPMGPSWLIEVPMSENLLDEPLLIHVEHRDLRTDRVLRASTTTRARG